jgi:hypothetical protein
VTPVANTSPSGLIVTPDPTFAVLFAVSVLVVRVVTIPVVAVRVVTIPVVILVVFAVNVVTMPVVAVKVVTIPVVAFKVSAVVIPDISTPVGDNVIVPTPV